MQFHQCCTHVPLTIQPWITHRIRVRIINPNFRLESERYSKFNLSALSLDFLSLHQRIYPNSHRGCRTPLIVGGPAVCTTPYALRPSRILKRLRLHFIPQRTKIQVEMELIPNESTSGLAEENGQDESDSARHETGEGLAPSK